MGKQEGHLRVEPVPAVPESHSVCDFDELSDEIQQQIAAAADGDECGQWDETTLRQVADQWDVVNYTDFLRLHVRQDG